MKPWKLSFLSTLDFRRWKAEDVVLALSEIGYDGVEWTLDHFNPIKMSIKELNRLIKLTKSKGMEVSEILVQQDIVTLKENIRKERIEVVKKCIKAASDVKVNIINLFTGPAPWDPNAPKINVDISEEKAWSLTLDAFNEFVSFAEKYKVYLAVEAVFGHLCHDYYTIKELLAHFKSKYLCVNMDPSHYTLYRNNIEWVVKRLGGKIKHVHMKDVIGKPGKHFDDFMFPLLGEGLVDWKSFLKALKDIGYKGFLSVEFESFNFYENVLEKDPVKAAKLSMDLLTKLIKLVEGEKIEKS